MGESSIPRQDPHEVLSFQMQLGSLQRSVTGAQSVVSRALEEVRAIQSAVKEGNADISLLDDARALELRLQDASESLTGDPTRTRRGATGAPSISSRIQNALFGTLFNTHGPTAAHRQQHDIARGEYEGTIAAIRTLVEVDLEAFKTRLDSAGVPWTVGRKIPGG